MRFVVLAMDSPHFFPLLVWLLSHHPEGLREMTAEDAANLNRLRRRATHARVRFFLVGEDTGCVEVEIEREA